MSEYEFSDPERRPHNAPPAITIHVLKENRRPVGFAPWPEQARKSGKSGKKRKDRK